MAELAFFSGTMDSGKSTLALQMDHNHAVRGRGGVLYTRNDRAGRSVLSSRLGLRHPAAEVTDDTDLWDDVVQRRTPGERVDYLVCDEAQFYTPTQVDQLGTLARPLRPRDLPTLWASVGPSWWVSGAPARGTGAGARPVCDGWPDMSGRADGIRSTRASTACSGCEAGGWAAGTGVIAASGSSKLNEYWGPKPGNSSSRVARRSVTRSPRSGAPASCPIRVALACSVTYSRSASTGPSYRRMISSGMPDCSAISSALAPARIRAGASAEEIAEQSGMPVEIIRRYDGPLRAEREYVTEQAQATRIGHEAGAPLL